MDQALGDGDESAAEALATLYNVSLGRSHSIMMWWWDTSVTSSLQGASGGSKNINHFSVVTKSIAENLLSVNSNACSAKQSKVPVIWKISLPSLILGTLGLKMQIT